MFKKPAFLERLNARLDRWSNGWPGLLLFIFSLVVVPSLIGTAGAAILYYATSDHHRSKPALEAPEDADDPPVPARRK